MAPSHVPTKDVLSVWASCQQGRGWGRCSAVPCLLPTLFFGTSWPLRAEVGTETLVPRMTSDAETPEPQFTAPGISLGQDLGGLPDSFSCGTRGV